MIIYITGSVLYRHLVKENNYGFRKLFYKLILGIFFLVTFFSIIKTGGKTINLGLVILSVILFFAAKGKLQKINRFSIKSEEVGEFKFLLQLLPLLLVLFAWRYYTLFSTEADIPVVLNMDGLKHSIRAVYLSTTGLETGNVNYFLLPDGLEPFHYFEAWTIALFGTLFKENFWVAGQVIVLPIFHIVIITGVLGIIQSWTKNYFIYLLAIGAVLWGAFYLEAFEGLKYLKYSGKFGVSPFDEHWAMKLSVAYMVVALFLNLLHEKKTIILGVLTLLALPVVSINLAPTLLTITTILLFSLYLFRKKLKLEFNPVLLLVPFLIAIFVLGFYEIFKPSQVFIDKPSLATVTQDLLDVDGLKRQLFLWTEKIFQLIFFFLPYLLVFLLIISTGLIKLRDIIKDQRFIVLVIIFTVGSFASVLFSILLASTFGASQILFYTMFPFFNLISFLLIIYLILNSSKAYFTALGYLLAIAFFLFFSYRTFTVYQSSRTANFDKYSIEYINSVVDELSELDNKKGLKLEHPDDIIKFNDVTDFVGFFVFGAFNDAYLTSITMGEMYAEGNFPTAEAKMLIPNAPFSVFIQQKIAAGEEINIEDATMEFIRENNIQYIFVSGKRDLPDYISRISLKEITDKNTGERLFIFREH